MQQRLQLTKLGLGLGLEGARVRVRVRVRVRIRVRVRVRVRQLYAPGRPEAALTMRPPVLKLLSFRVQSGGARPTRAQPMGKCVGPGLE